MLNLVFGGGGTGGGGAPTVPVTNQHIELRASRQLIIELVVNYKATRTLLLVVVLVTKMDKPIWKPHCTDS